MQETKTTYLYDAFIPYSRKDEKFARKLEADLERYRPPKGTIPDRRKLNIFRDIQDLVGNELSQAIKDALTNSRYLIVICSRNSRKAEWVGKGIDEFAKHNDKDKIIPVLITGQPNSEVKPDDEVRGQALPEALCNYLTEPLAVDVCQFAQDTFQQKRARNREARFQILALLLSNEKRES